MKPPAFHIMAKPIGALCNLDCQYCFYLEKEHLYSENENFKMSDEVLERFIRDYIANQDVPEVTFGWQGGEPTLMGVEFFKKAVALQKQYANGKTIHNTLQTNGTLLDDEWCQFFAENNFLVGLSIDGPKELHDQYRVTKKGAPTFDEVIAGLKLLQKHKVEFNTLTVIHAGNVTHPMAVYRFLKEIGSGFLQFIPLVERMPEADNKMTFAEPPAPDHPTTAGSVTEWCVPAEAYGDFLISIFNEWITQDVGDVFVQHFDVALGNWMGVGSSLCVFSEKCGSAMAIEHNGDLYSCDHYVYPKFKLGNLMNQSLGDMAGSAQQQNFGQSKKTSLPDYCKQCDVRFACNGECPKHRFINTPDGAPGLNYLCSGYKKFFHHIAPAMNTMGRLLKEQRPASDIMDMIRQSN